MATSRYEWAMVDTRLWIHEVMLKLEAYESWLEDTRNWCESNKIKSDRMQLALKMVTVLWVANKLGEPMSRLQALELVRADVDYDTVDDKVLYLPEKYSSMDLDQLLSLTHRSNISM